jgi:SAM-dependent methyltransferase
MAHAAQRHFVELASKSLPIFFSETTVLKVGSLNLGKSVRDFFENCHYVGLDVGKGEGVDVVCGGQEYDAPSGSFRHVISCEAMEHNPYWKETFANMVRLCQPGGLITMTCATTGRPEHGTSRCSPGSSPLSTGIGWEYYRNLTARDFRRAFDLKEQFSCHNFWYNWFTFDLYFLGIRTGNEITSDITYDWGQAIATISTSVSVSNQTKAMQIRQMAARLGGDGLFVISRSLQEKLNYLLNVTG